MQRKYLVINADDFGQSHGVNRGIIEAFERGVVTSTSLMVRWPAAAEAGRYAKNHPDLSVGLHVDLGEWVCRQGEWIPLYQVVPIDDPAAVAQELASQLASFHNLVGRPPSHLDSHQHVHRAEPVRSILVEEARSAGIPLRLCSTVRYCGGFYGQLEDGTPIPDQISLQTLRGLLKAVEPGVTELACHPAKQADFDTMYANERLQELEVLCDSRVRGFLEEYRIDLVSFNNIPNGVG